MKKRVISILLLLILSVSMIPMYKAETVQAATTTKSSAKSGFATVRRGSKGGDVEQLQRLLVFLSKNYNKPAWNSGKIDGKFGPATEKALKAFQKSQKGLAVDGICGPKTWDALFSLVS